MALKIVTDSTADLPPALARSLDITVIPLMVHFGERAYRDGLDLEADEFYRLLAAAPRPPTTSQPSPEAFAHAYRRLLGEGHAVLSLHLSAKLSGTYGSALQGAQTLGASRQQSGLRVMDSRQASGGLGLLVLKAARAAARGAALEEAVSLMARALPRAHFFGTVDTLEYLEKGGRIGKAQSLLGNLLQLKPIIACREGEAYPLGRVRSRRQALARLVELVEGLAGGGVEALAVLHATTPHDAAGLVERLRPLHTGGEVLISRIGPVMGAYLGPGALAVALLQAGGEG